MAIYQAGEAEMEELLDAKSADAQVDSRPCLLSEDVSSK